LKPLLERFDMTGRPIRYAIGPHIQIDEAPDAPVFRKQAFDAVSAVSGLQSSPQE
jgi:hypothetical protein